MNDITDFTDETVEDLNENRISPENSEAVEKNRDWIINKGFTEFETIDLENGGPVWRRQNADVLDRVKFVDENGEESEDIRAKSEATIWEIAKNEVLRERAFDFSFMTLKEADRMKLLRADLSDSIAKTTLGVVGITPVIKKEVNGEVAAEELAKFDAKLSVKALDEYLSDKGKDKAEVSGASVMGAALHESEKMERHISYIERKGYSENVVNAFKDDHKNFNEMMKSFFGKVWTSAKEYVANNRTRVIVDTAATLAIVFNPTSYAAVAAYAAYAAAGSLVWPIVEKRRKTIRQAKKEGRNYNDYKLGLKFNGLRKAWKDIRSDEKEWKRYKNRAKTGAAAGVVIGGGLGVLGTGLVTGVSALSAKICGTIIRSVASVTSQVMNVRDAKKDLKECDNAENKAAYNSAKLGLGIGATIATIASLWGIYNLLDSQVEVGTPKGVKGADDQAQETAQKAAKKTAKVAKKVAEQDVPSDNVEIAYPPVWNKESGISQKHFEELYGKYDANGEWQPGKITGILARQNKAFEEWNAAHPNDLREIEVKDPADTYKDMMTNLAKARSADSTLFAGKTDDQVLYQYIKNIEYSECAKSGPVVNGVHTLITVTDKNGVPTYASNQEEMQALFKILRCGEKTDVSSEALNATLDRIDLKTGAGIGEEFSRGQTNNSFWGYGEDCNRGVSMWRRGINAVKKVFAKEEPKPDTEVQTAQPTELQKDDAYVQSLRVRRLASEDANVSSVYADPKINFAGGTSDKFDHNLTDKVAHDGLKTGSSVTVRGISRKIEDAQWNNVKSDGGNGM